MASYSSFIAKRYLSSSRKTRFFSWISALSTLGIGIGIAVMIVVISVFNGFETELRERFLAANAHILISHYPDGLEHHEALEEALFSNYRSKLTGVAPFVHLETIAKHDYISKGVLVKGLIPSQRDSVQSLANLVRPKTALESLEKSSTPSAILGSGLLSLMNLQIGDQIKLLVPKKDDEEQVSTREEFFKIVGTYDSGLSHYDNKLFLINLHKAQDLLSLGNKVHGLELGLKNPNESRSLVRLMRQKIPYHFNEWQSFNPSIFDAIRNQRQMIALIVALVTLVASFNILTTIFVLVIQKQKEISIFKALGATNRNILMIFFKQSAFMGIIGAFLGILLALIFSAILVYFPFIDIPDVYMLSYLPVEFNWKTYLACASLGVFTSSLAGLYPALRASKILPTQGITQRRSE